MAGRIVENLAQETLPVKLFFIVPHPRHRNNFRAAQIGNVSRRQVTRLLGGVEGYLRHERRHDRLHRRRFDFPASHGIADKGRILRPPARNMNAEDVRMTGVVNLTRPIINIRLRGL